MKNSVKRIMALAAALLLTLLTPLFILTACGDTGGGEDSTAPTTTAAETNAVDTTPVFPEANYDGTDFVVLGRGENESSYGGMYIWSDMVSDTMEEAVFRRNNLVEDKYGVVISMVSESKPYENISVYISSGDLAFDLILDRRYYLSTLAQSGYLYDFNELDIDYDQPWWDSNCAEGYEVAGKLFYMANDISVSNLAGVRFLYFNKAIIETYQLTSPYELVEKNEWTLENFLNMIKSVSTDNGDLIWDANDTYGLLAEVGVSNSNVMHLLVGCGVKFVEKAEDGTFVSNAGNEITGNILTAISDALTTSNVSLTYQQASAGADTSNFANIYIYGRSLFAADHFLFVQNGMGVAEQFKNMTSDYGVAPNPKYNSEQESYYHKMDKYSLIWAIPNSSAVDYERLAIVTDYWAYQSSQTVMPAYYEITIKTKRVTESTASEMLDLIKGSIRYDITELFNVTVADVIYGAYTNGNLASTWTVSERSINATLSNLYEKINSLE